VIRTLTWFDKRTEEWQGETRLRDFRIGELRKLFGAASDDPMYDSYPVERRHLAVIRKWIDIPLHLGKYDYFIECSAIDANVVAGT
jgi:hypothetical protein